VFSSVYPSTPRLSSDGHPHASAIRPSPNLFSADIAHNPPAVNAVFRVR
jgi:hypothetical protein